MIIDYALGLVCMVIDCNLRTGIRANEATLGLVCMVADCDLRVGIHDS